MRKTISYIVLGMMLAVGLYSAWQINMVTGVIKAYNDDAEYADWDGPAYYSNPYNEGSEPADYAEPTME